MRVLVAIAQGFVARRSFLLKSRLAFVTVYCRF